MIQFSLDHGQLEFQCCYESNVPTSATSLLIIRKFEGYPLINNDDIWKFSTIRDNLLCFIMMYHVISLYYRSLLLNQQSEQ